MQERPLEVELQLLCLAQGAQRHFYLGRLPYLPHSFSSQA